MYKTESFYKQKESGARKLLAKEETVSGQVFFFWGRIRVYQTYFFFFWEMERAPMTDYLIGTDQKIPNRLININFWGRLKLQLNSLGFCTNDAILGPSAYKLLSPSATNP